MMAEMRGGFAAAPLAVGVVADEDVARDRLAQIIERDPSLSLAGLASDAASARALLRRATLQVLIVSLPLAATAGKRSGIQFIAAARRRREDVGILSVKHDLARPLVREAVDAGADACCVDDAPEWTVLQAIRGLSIGSVWLDPGLSRSLFRSRDRETLPSMRMTARERLVLHFITQGFTNEQMAATLACKPGTIHTHVSNLYDKLGVHDRASAVVSAMRHGLFSEAGF